VILQLVLSLLLAEARGHSAGWGLLMYLGYFTVLTNLLVALALSVPLIAPESRAGRFFRAAGPSTAIAASIVLVSVAYHVLLSGNWNPQGVHRLADLLLHYVMPVVYLVHWFGLRHGDALRWQDIPKWTVYPIAYFAYVLVRGVVLGVYPYPFLDAADGSYPSVVLTSLVILLGYVLIAAMLIAVGRLQVARATRGANEFGSSGSSAVHGSQSPPSPGDR